MEMSVLGAGIPIPRELVPPVYCTFCGWAGCLLECSVITPAAAYCPACCGEVEIVDEPVIVEAK